VAEKKSFAQSFKTIVQSGFPIILIQTNEVDRATESIRKMAAKWNQALGGMKQAPDYLKASGYQVMTWDCVNGWHTVNGEGNRTSMVAETGVFPHKGLEWLVSDKAKAGFYIMQNAHMFFDEKAFLPDGTPSLPKLIQLFRHQYESKTESKHLFLVGQSSEIPSELRPLTVVMDYPLPTREELEPFIREYVHETLGAKGVSDESIKEAASAASGLTTHEVESAICVAIVESEGKDIDRQIVFEEKVNAVKRSGLLDFVPAIETLDDVGGLENLKTWVRKMSKSFLYPEKARAYGKKGLPTPKGVMMAGIPGCIHPLTPIHDPKDGTSLTVAARHKVGEPFHVCALDTRTGFPVIAKAEAPRKFTKQPMIKVTMEEGSSISVTPAHRFWNGTTWIYASEVYELLQKSEPCLLESSLGNAP